MECVHCFRNYAYQRVVKALELIHTKTYISFQNFAVELQLENAGEFEMDHFLDQLTRAGGANYGTGVRDL